VLCKKTKMIYMWKVVEDSVPDSPPVDYREVGVRDYPFDALSSTPAADMFFHLRPGKRID
jgi:hypothetical protein